jgi:LuxR family transcriptional regulator, maltose regulon positive regulatory protein
MSSTASHILSTKLRPPTRLAEAIERPRLTTSLVERPPRVVLVIAAAGFGKTTLIAQCHAKTGAQGVWLSLDRNDQQPVTFIRHLIAGFNREQRVISLATESFVEGRITELDVDEVATRIVNDLERLDDPRIVFLDDYHLAETPAINDLVRRVIERGPVHLPIARYKADNALIELGVRDLQFNPREADAFLHHAHGLTLPPRELERLVRHTEGWGAGLQLASLFLKDSRDPAEAIRTLSGDTRDIADYLATEVVRRLAPEIRQFLLHTSVLERFNADICNAMLGRRDAQTMIEQVEALGLFLLPLDGRRRWYRYHHLFRDFLRAQLKRQAPEALAGLYRSASAWFEQAGLYEEAVNMALDADDFDHAAMLVEQSAITMIKQGHVPQVARWIQRFPPQVLDQNPRLPLYQCWAAAHMAQVHQSESLLLRVESATDRLCGDSVAIRELLQAEIHTLRTIVTLMADDIDRCQTMLATPFPDKPEFGFFSGCMSNVAGLVALARGEFDRARDAATMARRFHANTDCAYGVCYGHCIAGLTHLAQGRLCDARVCFTTAIQVAVHASGERSFNAAMPRVLMAMIDYEMDALDEAYAVLQDDLPFVDECAYVDIRTGGFLAIAGVLGARGRIHAALAYLDQAITINVEAAFERTCALASNEGIRLRLIGGDATGARRFAYHSGIRDDIVLPATWSRVPGLRAFSQCRLLVADGKAHAAIEPLQALAQLAKAAERRARKIQILSLLVVAQVQDHQSDAAFATVARVLTLGAEEGFIRSILDQGRIAGETFMAFARDRVRVARLPSVEAAYLARICEAAARQYPIDSDLTAPGHAATPIVVNGVQESLTDRELKVLRLLAKGAPNTQIGTTLFISVNTVRWHVANILSKLQVENRTQAAAAARALGLVR